MSANHFFTLIKEMGIETSVFIAGLSGGIAFLTKSNKMKIWEQFLVVLSGGLAANYLTPLVAIIINFNDKALYGMAFLIGYSGMKSVEIMLYFFHQLIKEKAQNLKNEE